MIQSMEVSIGDLGKTLLSCFKYLPEAAVYITGPTGTGKSEVVAQLCEQLGVPLYDVRLAGTLPEDLQGIPEKSGDGYFDMAMMGSLRDVFKEDAEGILFLDELNQADASVLAAIFQLVYDRKLNGKTLGEKVRVVAAGNVGDAYMVTDMSPALERRFVHIKIAPDKKAWLRYMSAKDQVYTPLLEFIEQRKDQILSIITPEAVVTPGQWTRVSDYLSRAEAAGELLEEDSVHMCIISGLVGASFAKDFVRFVTTTKTLTPLDLVHRDWKVIAKEVKSLVNEGKNSVLSELCEGVASYLGGRGSDSCNNITTQNNLAAFLKVLPAELSTKLIKQLWSLAPSVLTNMDADTLMEIQRLNTVVLMDGQ